MRNSLESEVRNSFALGYFLSLVNEYISYIKSDGILNFNDEKILNKALDLAEVSR